ncbi:DUF6789 family protein [Halalkalicoccus subterraneus]|uniref:DUF6789 family protein n=1 Tax=Halalkalicoccus subterraneus TaxID=2675002 RepID=UPI000EFAA948|nr:DUF6789 family protein [Halalkalicoccus subterraneus]
MNRFLRAISAGLAATTVMSLVFLFSQVQTRQQLGAPEAIARFAGVPEHHIIGFAIFAAAGVLLWPVVFVFARDLLANLPGGRDAVGQGLLFGLLLWVLFLILGTGELTWPFVILYLFFTLIGHLVYGFTLGFGYERLA